jgi:hypothetical protein
MFGFALSVVLQAFGISYAWLDQNLVSPFLSFARGFEFAIVTAAAILFFLISMSLVMKQAKRLPKSYAIEITDVYGRKVSIDGVRQAYSTHDAAESFARMYKDSFGEQYKFRVVGEAEQKDQLPADGT